MSGNLGDRIRQIRQNRKQTMKEFGESFTPKASKGVVSNWENGYNRPNKERLEKIASWGKYKSVNELLYGNFKEFTYDTLKNELAEKNVLYHKIIDYLKTQDKSLTQITDINEKEEALELRADIFLKESFENIFKILDTEAQEEAFFTNKDEVIPIINRVANYYVDYRIYALELKFNLNESVYFRHIDTRSLNLVSEADNEKEYEVNYHISINTSEPLKENARIDYEFICYPVLTIVIDNSGEVTLSSVRGVESLKEDKYKAIYGKDTFKKIEVELLKDALALSVFD